MEDLFNLDTVALDDVNMTLDIIDQTKLPNVVEVIKLDNAKDIWDAIYYLKVRGAPAIGVAAAYAMYLEAEKINADEYEEFHKEFLNKKEYFNSARPTAVNLSWALERMDKVCIAGSDKSISTIKKLLKEEAISIAREDTNMCKKIGEYGLSLVKKGDGLLTHCNAGSLATSKYGTATAPMYLGHERGYDFTIYCDETRPLLQGARLTAFELKSSGLNVVLACDNCVASLMRSGKINAVFVGTDRVAANGDVANKIGTSVVATVAKRYNIPFYVCAPSSSIDLSTPTGNDIKIEERPMEEVTDMWYSKRMAPEGIKVYNPAFDITDNELVSAIITEKGIVRAPYYENLRNLLVQ